MGTRSLTHVHSDDDEILVTIYVHNGGYPEGLGSDLAEFLNGFTVVNGLTLPKPERVANGMGCLAAQLIAHLKEQAGNVYIYPAGSKGCGEEYVYHVRPYSKGLAMHGEKKSVRLTCSEADWKDGSETSLLFDGPPDKFKEFLVRSRRRFQLFSSLAWRRRRHR